MTLKRYGKCRVLANGLMTAAAATGGSGTATVLVMERVKTMIQIDKLTPMLRMTDAEIDDCIHYGLYKMSKKRSRKRERIYRRDECQYDRYADDWEREGDD